MTKMGSPLAASSGTVALDEGVAVSLLDEVDLVEHDPAGLCGERRIILFKLQHQSLGFLNGIRLLIEGSGVDHVKQNLRAGKMTEEQMTETCAFGSTFDEARARRRARSSARDRHEPRRDADGAS